MSTTNRPADGKITSGRGIGDYVYCFEGDGFYPMRLKYGRLTIKDMTFISTPGVYDSHGTYLFNTPKDAKPFFSFTPQTVARIDILASTSTGPSASNFVKGTLLGGAALGAAAAMAPMESQHTVKVTWRDDKDSKESIITFNNSKGFQTFIGQLGSLLNQPNEANPVLSSPEISSADEILKFKKLMDEGIISQAEFDAKKKQLLGLSGIKEIDTPKETVVIGANADAATLLKRAFMFLEDGEWSKADAYCEQVLNQDPENAEAYLGKLMAELCVRRQEDLPNCEQPFNTSNNYQKAVRFGGEEFAGVLSEYIDHINERNENTRLTDIYDNAVSVMKGANSESAYKDVAEIFKTISGFKDSDELAEQCLERSEVCRKEAIYASAISLMNENTVNGYKAAAETFKIISEFKDSDELAEQCFERAEVCRKDSIYASAMSQKAKNTVSGYDAAIKTFQKISGWKDADEQIYACQRMSEELKVKEEAERLERERQAEQSRIAAEKASKKFKRIIAITVSMIVACIVFVIVLINVIIPKQKYNEAMSLLDSGDYDAAYALLQELGHGDEITSSKYDRAKKLLDSGDYDAAYVLLYESGHSDEITSSKYDRAMKLIDSGDYDAAYALLEEARRYREIASNKYDRAMVLMDSGNYDEALLLLKGLHYKDSADKIDVCKYSSAMELYNSQQYEAAYNAFNSMNYKDSATKAAECVFQKQKAGLTNVTVGSTIKFGLYEQDYDTGKEEIEWIVLAVDGDKALIISKHVLAGQPYNRTQTDITWEECSLRTWLNETFYNDAFSADHQEMIISSTVSADENPTFSVDPGNSTTDKVFLLSISDVNEYFGSDSDRRCSGTTCLGNTGYYWWLLRSPGSQAYHVSIVEGFSKNYFYYISGNVNSFGINVDTPCGVRPAMWINLES